MAKKFVCVEVGDRLSKVVECLGTEKNRKVKSAFFFETPEECVQDGVILDPLKFMEALSKELAGNGCSDANEIMFTISSSKVATREVKMPVLTDSKIGTVVENNKTEYFPLDISSYQVLFRVMSRVKKGENKGCNVIVIAMPESIMEACAQVATGLKMRLKCVDAVCSSLVDGVAMLKQPQVTAFVHVDCTNTNMCFMRGTELMLQRTLSFGGDEMISAYREECGADVDYLEALDDLTNLSAEDNIRGRLDDEDITALLERVVGSISRSVEFFNTNKGGGVQQLVLTGVCGNLLGLEELLEQATAVPTMQMSQMSSSVTLRSISATPAYYMSTVQTGFRGVNFAKDLDPKRAKGKRANKGAEIDMPTAILISILLTVFAVYWGYSSVLDRESLEKQISQLDADILNLAYVDEVSATHTKYSASKDSLLNFTANTFNHNENLVYFLAELEAKMPSEILLLSAGCTGVSVNMNIVVGSLTEAATVVQKFRTFDSVSVVQVSGLAVNWIEFVGEQYSSQMQQGFEEVSFSLICTYGVNPYTSGLNPYSSVLGLNAGATS